MQGAVQAPIGPSNSTVMALALGERWLAPGNRHRDHFGRALIVTLCLHGFVLALIIGRTPDRLGDDRGTLDGVAVEVVDAADFDRRRSNNLAPGKDRVEARPAEGATAPETTPEQTPSPDIAPIPATPPAPPQQQVKEAPKEKPKEKEEGQDVAKQASLDLQVALDPSVAAPMKPAVDLEMKLPPPGNPGRAGSKGSPGAQVSAAERYLDRRSKPAQAVYGEVDAYTRLVNNALERTKPVSPGAGLVVVEFVISETGRLQDLRVAKSSGLAKLDDIVLNSVRTARFQVPPPTATLRDRTFEITYSYK